MPLLGQHRLLPPWVRQRPWLRFSSLLPKLSSVIVIVTTSSFSSIYVAATLRLAAVTVISTSMAGAGLGLITLPSGSVVVKIVRRVPLNLPAITGVTASVNSITVCLSTFVVSSSPVS